MGTNLRGRPQLNGIQGEVLSSGVDADGFITVRIPERLAGRPCIKVLADKLQSVGGNQRSPPRTASVPSFCDSNSPPASVLSRSGLSSVSSKSPMAGSAAFIRNDGG